MFYVWTLFRAVCLHCDTATGARFLLVDCRERYDHRPGVGGEDWVGGGARPRAGTWRCNLSTTWLTSCSDAFETASLCQVSQPIVTSHRPPPLHRTIPSISNFCNRLQGVAHILEHLAFNATEEFSNHEIVKFLESVGAQFGACQVRWAPECRRRNFFTWQMPHDWNVSRTAHSAPPSLSNWRDGDQNFFERIYGCIACKRVSVITFGCFKVFTCSHRIPQNAYTSADKTADSAGSNVAAMRCSNY